MTSKSARKLAILLTVTTIGSSIMIGGCSKSKESGATTALTSNTPMATTTEPAATAKPLPTIKPLETMKPLTTPTVTQNSTATQAPISDSSTTYKKGTLTDTTFESEFIGIKYESDGNYMLAKQEQLDSVLEAGCDIAYGDDGKQYYDYVNATSVIECMISAPVGSPNITITVQNLGTMPLSEEQCAELMKNEFTNINMNYVVEDGLTQETITGETYYVMSLTSTVGSIELKQKNYLRRKDDRLIIITTTSVAGQEEEISNMMGQLKPYK